MTTQHDNAPASIFTDHGIVVTEVPRDNSRYTGSLAALYDETWKQQDPHAVFKLVDIPRDVKEADRTRVDIPEKSCVLSWRVGVETPCILRSPFQIQNVFVRDEYRRVLAEFWKLFSEGLGHLTGYVSNKRIADTEVFPPINPFLGLNIKEVNEIMVPVVIVTGTPGIGKSVFLLYLLALRLLARQTTIIQFESHEFMVFEETGVYVCSDLNSELRFLPEHTWFLVDSNNKNKEPLQSYITSCLSYPRKLIVSASPRKERFEFKSKITRLEVTWMKTFELWELIAARKDQIFETIEKECVYEAFYHKYGPIARAAFTYAGVPEKHKKNILENLYNVPWDSLSQTIRNMSSGCFDTPFSHNTLIAEPTVGDRSDFSVQFASKSIAELVIETFLNVERAKAQELYRFFLASPKARTTAGHLLEATALITFPRGGAWHIRQMEDTLKRDNSKSLIYAYNSTARVSTLIIGRDKDTPVQIIMRKLLLPKVDFSKIEQRTCDLSEERRSREKKEERSREKKKERSRKKEKESEEESKKNVAAFCIPKASNNPGFDAWIHCPERKLLVIFQVTITRQTHAINTKALQWLGLDEGVKIVLVVVTDEEGGKQVSIKQEDSGWINEVYRLVM